MERKIKIIAMNKDNFNREEAHKVQEDYFMGSLQDDFGYTYGELSPLDEKEYPPGSLLLFQYDDQVIAQATYKSIDKKPPKNDPEAGGTLFLEEGSVRVFKPPITEDEVKEYFHEPDSTFKKLTRSQGLRTTNEERKKAFLDMLDKRVEFKSISVDDPDTSRDDHTEAEKDYIAKRRVCQGEFRKKLLSRWGNRCAVCGMTIGKLLEACHIKPWGDSDDEERREPNNGFILSENPDNTHSKRFIIAAKRCDSSLLY
jgi:hypothetical protein